MKRDMDLIREILLRVEAADRFNGAMLSADASGLGISGCDKMQFAYNTALLIEAKMLTGNAKMAVIGQVLVGGLTWTGHEFLDTIRDNDIWAKAKTAASKVGSVSIAFMWELAKTEIKVKLGVT